MSNHTIQWASSTTRTFVAKNPENSERPTERPESSIPGLLRAVKLKTETDINKDVSSN